MSGLPPRTGRWDVRRALGGTVSVRVVSCSMVTVICSLTSSSLRSVASSAVHRLSHPVSKRHISQTDGRHKESDEPRETPRCEDSDCVRPFPAPRPRRPVESLRRPARRSPPPRVVALDGRQCRRRGGGRGPRVAVPYRGARSAHVRRRDGNAVGRRHPSASGMPEWDDAVEAAALTAERLGMEIAIATSAGWSASGGPWVKPEDAMKKVVWSEIVVEGGPVDVALPDLPDSAGGFQDAPRHGADGTPAGAPTGGWSPSPPRRAGSLRGRDLPRRGEPYRRGVAHRRRVRLGRPPPPRSGRLVRSRPRRGVR